MGSFAKFTPPAFNLPLVERRRLVDAMTTSMTCNAMTLLVAPTGSGKSALLVQAMEKWLIRGGEVAWYACDRFDAEAGHFLSMLEKAISADVCDVGQDSRVLGPLFLAHDPKGLADTIVARGRRMVVFIDNFHLCDSDEVVAAVDVLVRESQGLLHLAISARRVPRLTLGHLRLRGLVREFDAAELAFTIDEARQLIGPGGQADAGSVERVIQRTEGWAAGLQLVRLLIQSGASLRHLAEEFSGANQDVGQLLNEEVFRTLPPAFQAFLLKVGPLDCISVELAEAVTGDPSAHRWFHELYERNLFVLPLDRQRTQVRLHALFRDFLIMQGGRQDPTLAVRSLRRAAQWYRDRGDWIEAIEHAIAAGDLHSAEQWLEARASELITADGETARFLNFAERLEKGGRQRPGIVLWRIWAVLFSGDYGRANDLMAGHLHALKAYDPGGRQLGLVQFVVAYFAHRYVDALQYGQRWLACDSGANAFERETVWLASALCHRTQLDMAQALKFCDLARQEIARAPTGYGLAWLATVSGHFMLVQGHPAAACREIEGMLARQKPNRFMEGTAELVLADAYYERGQFDQARYLVRRSLPTIAHHCIADIALCGWRVAAKLALQERGAPAALDLLRDVEPLAIRRFGLVALKMLRLLRAEIILEFDPEIRRNLEIADPGDDTEIPTELDTPEIAEWQRLLNAKSSLISGHPKRAIAECLPILTATRASRRLRLWVQASCVKAAAHQDNGEATFALRTLVEAIEQAAELGMRQSIVDQRAILRPLVPALTHYLAAGKAGLTPDVVALIEQLTGKAGTFVPDDDDGTDGEMVAGAGLSKKEYRILTMVSQGMTNGQVVERMFISLPTVKWHLHNIYTKLGVRTRTAAVAKARTLGMLQ